MTSTLSLLVSSLYACSTLVLAESSPAISQSPFYFPNVTSPHPFDLRVSPSFIERTMKKVRNYQPTVGLVDGWSNEGPPVMDMSSLAKYWSNDYRWNLVEQELNEEFHHYATVVDGKDGYPHPIPLHFIHERSNIENSVPLLLLHGWPSSSLEWSKVIKPLVAGTSKSNDSFHIVAPDLPGFGFSPAPTQPGLGPRHLVHAFDGLMQQLGYRQYGLVTTDLGWFTGMWMAAEVPDSILGHMCHFYLATPTDDDLARQANQSTTAEENAYLSAANAWQSQHTVYSTAHQQKPLALGQALADTPVGFLGWVYDLLNTISAGYQYSPESLISNAMMLWIPGPYANIRAYLEFFKPESMSFPQSRIRTGISEWSWRGGPFSEVDDLPLAPEDWVRRTSPNLLYFKRHDSGGHFPSITEPGQWVLDVRSFFKLLK